MNKTITTIIAVLALGAGLLIGHSLWQTSQTEYIAGSTATSTAGTTNTSSKIASVAMNPTTSDASSTATLNTSSTDRIITSTEVFCDSLGSSKVYLTGGGLANFSVNSATSSVASQNGNTNYLANITLTTTTPTFYVASTTEGFPASGAGRIWAAGSYLIDTFNATNTAACTINHKYFVL